MWLEWWEVLRIPNVSLNAKLLWYSFITFIQLDDNRQYYSWKLAEWKHSFWGVSEMRNRYLLKIKMFLVVVVVVVVFTPQLINKSRQIDNELLNFMTIWESAIYKKTKKNSHAVSSLRFKDFPRRARSGCKNISISLRSCSSASSSWLAVSYHRL